MNIHHTALEPIALLCNVFKRNMITLCYFLRENNYETATIFVLNKIIISIYYIYIYLLVKDVMKKCLKPLIFVDL